MCVIKKLWKRRFLISEPFTGWFSWRLCLLSLESNRQLEWCTTFLILDLLWSITRIICLSFCIQIYFGDTVLHFIRHSGSESEKRLLEIPNWYSFLFCAAYLAGQIAWTMLTIIIVIYQVRAAVPMIMDGIIWVVLPCMTVAFNDTMAYFFGMAFGRKYAHRSRSYSI